MRRAVSLLAWALFCASSVTASTATEALADLRRFAVMSNVSAEEIRGALDRGLRALEGETRLRKCHDAFIAGELHRLAAAAGGGEPDATEALERFRAMRVEYIDLVSGGLGYVGEARVLRQQGNRHAALEVLRPLLGDDVTDVRIRRVAELEAMEVLLETDPAEAEARARALGEGGEWVLARALAKRGERDAALELARLAPVASTVFAWDRLSLIDELSGLSNAERTEWAALLAGFGHEDRAMALLRERCPDASVPLLATLLERAGRPDEAAEVWLRGADESPRRRLAAARAFQRAGDSGRASGHYRVVIAAGASIEDRRDALRQYVAIVGVDGARAELASNSSLVGGDPYLVYCDVVRRRGSADPGELAETLAALDVDSTAPAVRASAVLLRAQLEPDPRRSLALLDERSELLAAHEATAAISGTLRTQRWIELGMIDAAADALAEDSGTPPSGLLLDVARVLAERVAAQPDAATTRRIVRLAARAIGSAMTDESVALDAARIMHRVGAHADAERVLTSLDSAPARRLRAELALERDDAPAVLDLLEGDRTNDAALLRARALVTLGRATEALDPLRLVRRSTGQGSDPWWNATIALAFAQLDLGNAEAARSVVRVAEALHPVSPKRAFHAELERLRQELD